VQLASNSAHVFLQKGEEQKQNIDPGARGVSVPQEGQGQA
jgi:hypothetical protein